MVARKSCLTNHHASAKDLDNLALDYLKQSDSAKAAASLDEALAIRERALGPDHPETATRLNILARLYQDQREYAKAEPLYKRALAIREKALGPDHPDTATVLYNLACLYAILGDYAKPDPLYERALAIVEKAFGPAHPATATCLNGMAELHVIKEDYTKAKHLYERALAIREEVLGPENLYTGLCLGGLALLYDRRGYYSEATTLYERALAIVEKVLGPEHPDLADTLNNLAGLYLKRADYAKAEPLYERALAISEKALNPRYSLTANSLNGLADLYSNQGDHARAEALYQRALAIKEKYLGPDHPGIAICLNKLATLYWRQANYTKAEALYYRALAIHEKSVGQDHTLTATSLCGLAALYRDQADYAKAKPLYERALAIVEKALGPDCNSTATCLSSFAGLYYDLGGFAKAEPLYERALAIKEKALGPDHPDTALVLHNLALLYAQQKEYTKAERLCERALAINGMAMGPEHPDTASCFESLAQLYASQGDYSKAEPLYNRALAIKEKVLKPEHPSIANTLHNLAALYGEHGDYAKAKPLYERALTVWEEALGPDHPATASTLANLSVDYIEQGDYAKALSFCERAQAINVKVLGPEHPDTVLRLKTLASIYTRAGDYDKAKSSFCSALRGHTKWITCELSLLTTSKRIFFLRKHLDLDNYAASLSYFRDEFIASALWCRINRHGLLQEIERQQLLLCGLTAAWADWVETLRGLVNQLASTSLALVHRQQLQQRRDEIEVELFRAFPQLVIPLVEVEEVAAALPAASLLIEFQRFTVIGHSDGEIDPAPRYLALLLPAGAAPHAVDLGPAALLERSIEDALQASAEELDDAAMLWEAVSEQLFTPVMEHLSGCGECFLSPDAELHRIPFTALPLPGAPGRLLAEVCQVHVIASARQLLTTDDSPTEGTRPLVVADPTFGPGASGLGSPDCPTSQNRSRDMGSLAVWGPLPATAVEGRQVASSLRGSLLLAEEASARNLQRACHPRVLHVATHGYFLPDQDIKATPSPGHTFLSDPTMDLLAPFRGEDPMLRSGLVLAGANGRHNDPDDDGYLTALEATHLDLQGTELVTLSACDTGRGDIHTGEGVYGLQRALIVAGARSTLLSLWKVPDEATCDFMVRFYTHLKEGMGRSDALLTVQREFRQHENLAWRHHCYWAAWQLVGDWRPIQGL
jgi:tetratricopeptide (TPR) repeat protein/CHAT domain-containing protein